MTANDDHDYYLYGQYKEIKHLLRTVCPDKDHAEEVIADFEADETNAGLLATISEHPSHHTHAQAQALIRAFARASNGEQFSPVFVHGLNETLKTKDNKANFEVLVIDLDTLFGLGIFWEDLSEEAREGFIDPDGIYGFKHRQRMWLTKNRKDDS